jgi:hypothetical protein
MLLWDLVPEKGTLIGDTGYLGPLFKNVQHVLFTRDNLQSLAETVLSIGGIVLGLALVRGRPWASALIRKGLR